MPRIIIIKMSNDISKRVCCTCLSQDRKLYQLCRVPDGVNLLYMLLMCDSDAYREGFFKDTTSLMVCWECRAHVSKMMRFRSQTCVAMKRLKEYTNGRNEQKELQTLSRLTSNTSTVHEIEINMFVDCSNNMENELAVEEEEIKENVKSKKIRKCKVTTDTIALQSAYKCESCALGFKDESSLNSHMMEHKKKNRKLLIAPVKYACSECDMSFDNKGAKWKHIQKCHRVGHECGTCQKVFAFKHNLQRHLLIHSGPPPLSPCPHCHKLVRTSLLAAHSRTHATRSRVQCEPCGKAFVCRATYESHLKYASAHAGKDSLKHACDVCEKKFRSRGELRDHVAYRHEARPNHKCPICDKALATQRCVTRHVRRAHDGVQERARDKMCDYCGLAFRDKQSLSEHARRHTGARPLTCERCPRAFRQRAALHAHARRLHPAGRDSASNTT